MTDYPVEDFGAVGDGVTDDTAAIQAAINAAPNGGCVVLSTHYRLASMLTMNLGAVRGLHLRGTGGAAALWPDAGITALKLTNQVGGDGDEIGSVRDVRILFHESHAANRGLWLTNDDRGLCNWVVDRVGVLGCGSVGQFNYTGIGIDLQFALKGVIRDCVVSYWGTGIKSRPVNANHCNANLITGSKIRVNTLGADLELQTGAMSGCTLEANSTSLRLDGTNVFSLTGSHFEGAGPGTLTGIECVGGALTSMGNSFLSHSTNRDVVVSGGASWASFGDQCLSGNTTTSSQPVFQAATPGSLPSPVGTQVKNFTTLRAGGALSAVYSDGVIRGILGLGTDDRITLDGVETATTAGVALGFLRVRVNGTIRKIPYCGD